MNNTVVKRFSVPSFHTDLIENFLNQMAEDGCRFISKNKTKYLFEKGLEANIRFVVYAYSNLDEEQAVKSFCMETSLNLVCADSKDKILIYSYALNSDFISPELDEMQIEIKKKRKAKTVFFQTIILVIYGGLIFYFSSGPGEYTYNQLEAHLHHSEIVFEIVCVVVMALLTLLRLLTFFSFVLKKPTALLKYWQPMKKTLSILTVVFLLGSQIGIGILQGKNSGDTRDGIPDGLQYVAIEQFLSEDENDFINGNAQTNLGKTDAVVSENYAVYLYSNNHSIDSRCIRILDDTILSDYYYYEKNKFADTEAAEIRCSLNEAQKELLNAKDGFIRNDTHANIVEVVFLTDYRIIRVELRGINAGLDTILTQIAKSFC